MVAAGTLVADRGVAGESVGTPDRSTSGAVVAPAVEEPVSAVVVAVCCVVVVSAAVPVVVPVDEPVSAVPVFAVDMVCCVAVVPLVVPPVVVAGATGTGGRDVVVSVAADAGGVSLAAGAGAGGGGAWGVSGAAVALPSSAGYWRRKSGRRLSFPVRTGSRHPGRRAALWAVSDRRRSPAPGRSSARRGWRDKPTRRYRQRRQWPSATARRQASAAGREPPVPDRRSRLPPMPSGRQASVEFPVRPRSTDRAPRGCLHSRRPAVH